MGQSCGTACCAVDDSCRLCVHPHPCRTRQRCDILHDDGACTPRVRDDLTSFTHMFQCQSHRGPRHLQTFGERPLRRQMIPGFSSSTYASKCMSCTARIIAGFNPFADPIATSSLPDEASISSQCKVGMLCVPWRIWLRDMRVRVLRRHVRSSESLQLARCCARISCRRRSWRWTDG